MFRILYNDPSFNNRYSSIDAGNKPEKKKKNKQNKYESQILPISKLIRKRPFKLGDKTKLIQDNIACFNNNMWYFNNTIRKYKDWNWMEEPWEVYRERPGTMFQYDVWQDKQRALDPDYYQKEYKISEEEPSKITLNVFYDTYKNKQYVFRFTDLIEAFRGKNKEVRGKHVIFYDKEKNKLGIKWIPFKSDGKRKYVPFNGKPDFWKRKIFYLAIIPYNSKFDYCVVNGYNRENVKNWYIRYTKKDLDNKYEKLSE